MQATDESQYVSREEFERLQCELGEVKAEKAELRDENEAQAEEIAELKEYRSRNELDKAEIRQDVHGRLEDRSDEGETTALEDIWLFGQPIGKIMNGLIEDQGNDQAGETDEGGSRDESLTPFEQVMRAGEEGVLGHLTAKDDRAQTIGEHFGQWASKAPNGLVIKDNLKNLIETATGENLYWKQVYRACKALEEATRGAIEFTKHRRFGWVLVAEPEIVRRIGRLSSAPGG